MDLHRSQLKVHLPQPAFATFAVGTAFTSSSLSSSITRIPEDFAFGWAAGGAGDDFRPPSSFFAHSLARARALSLSSFVTLFPTALRVGASFLAVEDGLAVDLRALYGDLLLMGGRADFFLVEDNTIVGIRLTR